MKFLLRLLYLSSSLLALGSPALRGQVSIAWEEIEKPLSLSLFSGLTPATDRLPYYASGSTAALTPFTGFARTLLDDADATTARATLGLGSISTQAASAVAITGGSIAGITDLAVADGGTGASNAANARTNLGLVIGTHVAGLDIYGNPVLADAEVFAFDNDLATPNSVNNQVVPLIAARFSAWLRDTGYLYSDGATINRGIVYMPGPRGAINGNGADVFELLIRMKVPTTPFPSGQGTQLYYVGNSTTPGVWPTFHENSFGVRFEGNNAGETGNKLLIYQFGLQANGFASRTLSFPNFRSDYSGRDIAIRIQVVRGTASPTVWVDGVNITAAGTAGAVGTSIPQWLDAAAMNTSRHLATYNYLPSAAPVVIPVIGPLSDADHQFWLTSGSAPFWLTVGGSMADHCLGTAWFNSSGRPYESLSSSDSAGFTAGDTGGNDARVKVAIKPLVARQRILVTGTITFNSGSGTVSSQIERSTLDNSNIGALVSGSAAFTGSGPIYYVMESTENLPTPTINFGVPPGTTINFTVSNFKVTPLGALTIPRYQAGRVVGDATDIGDNCGRLVGMSQVTARKDFQFTVNSSTNGNEQLLGGEVIDSTLDVLDSIEQEPLTGTPTTAIGSVSAGAQYKTSGALAAGINPVSLVTRKTASNNLWTTSSSTDVVRTTVKGHRR